MRCYALMPSEPQTGPLTKSSSVGASFTADRRSSVVTLPETYSLSEIRVKLWDGDSRYYRYALEVSADGKNYQLVANHSKDQPKGLQVIRFRPRPVKFIRLHGLYGSKNKNFHVVELEAYCIPPPPPRPSPPKSKTKG